MSQAFFILFGVFTMLMALGVVFARSPVYSAFSLILSFFGLSALYIMWGTTFIGMIQVLIYTGAIVVLFVFVVMLLDLGKGSGGLWNNWLTVILSVAGAWLFAVVLLRSLNLVQIGGSAFGTPPTAPVDEMKKISLLLFNEYLWPFEVLSVFLLALIVAIFALTRPEDEKHRIEERGV